jgi:transposase
MRGEKREDVINERLDAFDEKTYKERYRVERTFAWEDSYRKLAQCYEILEATRLGFKYLAFSMMNLKEYL